jgi:hypothetical protein
MLTWAEIKRRAIVMNSDRKTTGASVEEMVKQVRLLIIKNGYSVGSPIPTNTGGFEFSTKDGKLKLEYLPNEWR